MKDVVIAVVVSNMIVANFWFWVKIIIRGTKDDWTVKQSNITNAEEKVEVK